MLYALIPFLSAAFYGLGYVLLERVLKSSVNILTYMVCSNIIFTCILAVIAIIRRADFQPSKLFEGNAMWLFLGSVLVNVAGWIITLNSLQKNTAVYTAFAEISYPLFSILFVAVLFGVRNFGWQSMLGSALIFAGSVLLVMAQSSTAHN